MIFPCRVGLVMGKLVLMSAGVMSRCRSGEVCWRPLCPHRHGGKGRAARWAEAWVGQEEELVFRACHGADRRDRVNECNSGEEGEVQEIIIVSDAVEGTFVDLDGEGVDMPVPKIAAKIPEVVETIPQEHASRHGEPSGDQGPARARGCASSARRDRRVGEVGLTGTSATADRRGAVYGEYSPRSASRSVHRSSTCQCRRLRRRPSRR